MFQRRCAHLTPPWPPKAPVIGVLEGDDAALAGSGSCGANDDIVGVGTGVAEVDAPFPDPWDEREQLFGEADRVRMHSGERAGAGGAPSGVRNRLGHLRVPVTEAGGSPRGAEIEQTPASCFDEPAPFARFERQREETELLDPRHGSEVTLVEPPRLGRQRELVQAHRPRRSTFMFSHTETIDTTGTPVGESGSRRKVADVRTARPDKAPRAPTCDNFEPPRGLPCAVFLIGFLLIFAAEVAAFVAVAEQIGSCGHCADPDRRERPRTLCRPGRVGFWCARPAPGERLARLARLSDSASCSTGLVVLLGGVMICVPGFRGRCPRPAAHDRPGAPFCDPGIRTPAGAASRQPTARTLADHRCSPWTTAARCPARIPSAGATFRARGPGQKLTSGLPPGMGGRTKSSRYVRRANYTSV